MHWLAKVLISLAAAFAINRAHYLWKLQNYGRVVYNHKPGPCQIVPGVEHGSEDIQVMKNGKAFISSGMRNYNNINDPMFAGRIGKILLFDFARPNESAVEMKVEGSLDMRSWAPHGISVWEGDSGIVTLFVVVHRPSGESIEKFTYTEKRPHTLVYAKTISENQFMRKLNDVVAIDADSFYFANYHYFYGPLEDTVGLLWSNIVFFSDVSGFRIVASGFHHANGINSSPDGRYVYLATSRNFVKIFRRNSDNSLTFVRDVALGTSPDNIDIDSAGDLWMGCHPIIHKLMTHLADPEKQAPSQVLRLRLAPDGTAHVTEVYADDGGVLKGATVAVRHERALLVGTVHDRLLYCELKHLDI